MRVLFSPPGLAHEGAEWTATDPSDELLAALVELGASPRSAWAPPADVL